MLIAAGFKTVTPKTASQQQKLQQLQVGHVAQVQKNGKTYYVVADLPQNVVYVGGPQQYQAYQQLRIQNQQEQENLETAEMYQDAAMDWGCMGWLGSWVGTNGLWGRGRTRRRRGAVLSNLLLLIQLTARHYECSQCR